MFEKVEHYSLSHDTKIPLVPVNRPLISFHPPPTVSVKRHEMCNLMVILRCLTVHKCIYWFARGWSLADFAEPLLLICLILVTCAGAVQVTVSVEITATSPCHCFAAIHALKVNGNGLGKSNPHGPVGRDLLKYKFFCWR